MKSFLLLIFIALISVAKADTYSMRKCMLLPIPDSVGNVIGFKVYEGVEKYIEQKKWCEYSSSSEVIEVFSKYRDKLSNYLDDPQVIKTVADRLQVGTIIRIKIVKDGK